ncbi:hypothetical protein CSA80_01510 [Candidatus Saccharibacteria bacterium]|nr:MAG: hypothetical protein CSA80_01510 [Candidatus Saccharibacteria bacterium]
MKRSLLIVTTIVVLAGIGGAVYWWGIREAEPETTATVQPAPAQSAPEPKTAEESTMPQEPAQPTESTTLTAVGNYSGSATATRTTSGNFVHTVTAQLGAPADGDFYEGWLVIPGSGFVSTGKLVQESGGEWSLNYTSDQDLSAYTQVVITEETGANGLDNVPEDHVLEGSF